MIGSMTQTLLTPSKITAWLECAHYLTLKHRVDRGELSPPRSVFGEMAKMLLDKGLVHEDAVLQRYQDAAIDVAKVPDKETGESFAAWVDRVGHILDQGHKVIFQMPFVHDGVRGVADFLECVGYDDGTWTYEPVDAKLARSAAKPGHLLQLCFYAEAIAALTGRRPGHLHIELGSGSRETIRSDDVMAYWRRLRNRLAKVVAESPIEPTQPEPCDHCAFCEFLPVCEAEWRATDSLVYIANIRKTDRASLVENGVVTIADLAALSADVSDLDPARQNRLVRQAGLQVLARGAPVNEPPPFELLETEAGPTNQEADLDAPEQVLTGFAALPEPDEGDIFLDFEGHPFWKADVGLFFLFGLIELNDAGEWQYKAFWAHDRAEEATATRDVINYLTERRARFPNMHVYHYNHTERSSLERLTIEYGVAESTLDRLVSTGLFVDLYPIVTGAMQVGVESYGLKSIELLPQYERDHEIDRGAGAIIEYEHWMADRDPTRLDRIAKYNEDDVRATLAVRDWLVEHRPDDVAWRDPVLEPQVSDEELDERIEALYAFGVGTPEHLMGDVLGYWRREKRVVAADCLRLSMADTADQHESPSAIAGLEFHGFEERTTPTGRPKKWPVAVFTFPIQPVDPDIDARSTLIVALDDSEWLFFSPATIDRDSGTLEISWNQNMIDQAILPSSLVHYSWVAEGAKREALVHLADRLLAGHRGAPGLAILHNDAPSFRANEGPTEGVFTGEQGQTLDCVTHLEESYLPIQGPPGSGKTYTGAQLIHRLVMDGKRVGITAMSHAAIENMTRAMVGQFALNGNSSKLRAARKGNAPADPPDGVFYTRDNAVCGKNEYNVVAGTPWLFASQAMRDNPVDVLIVDEAGQLGLADTLAASTSAKNVILLGDPQQLPQVSQAKHPNRSGVSALEHILGENVRVISRDRGVLLDRTWRMHPDVCEFISETMYEGLLVTEEHCAIQTTAAGTGLRWIRAEHAGCSTESPEEADIVAQTVGGLLDKDWTNRDGEVRPLGIDDIIVVTPYNDQRRLITATLDKDPRTAGVEVGTVDKFQGREATVVLFSMATSSSEHMPRNVDFLFSKNRLNVAISRARCLAYLICTEELLDTRARTVGDMELISALCSFVEHSEVIGRTPVVATT